MMHLEGCIIFLRSSTAGNFQVQHNIIAFDALLQKCMYSFVNPSFHFGNYPIKSLIHFDLFFKSSCYKYYPRFLYC